MEREHGQAWQWRGPHARWQPRHLLAVSAGTRGRIQDRGTLRHLLAVSAGELPHTAPGLRPKE